MEIEGVMIIIDEIGCPKKETMYKTKDVFDVVTADTQRKFVEWTMSKFMGRVRKGDTITIKPIMSFEAEYEIAWNNMTSTSQFAICGLMHAGKKIQAMKLVCQETGWGLKEGKAMIDSGWIWTKIGEVI